MCMLICMPAVSTRTRVAGCTRDCFAHHEQARHTAASSRLAVSPSSQDRRTRNGAKRPKTQTKKRKKMKLKPASKNLCAKSFPKTLILEFFKFCRAAAPPQTLASVKKTKRIRVYFHHWHAGKLLKNARIRKNDLNNPISIMACHRLVAA